ncbi:hypothetical protein H4R33_002960 [Dimargaris cristalligena]|nr:hypothetical protein H4R33_002960 [Dimargaris cristalligena]
MSCSPFCAANFWDLNCSHKQVLSVCSKDCKSLRIGLKADAPPASSPPAAKAPSKPGTPPPASKTPSKAAPAPANPQSTFSVPIGNPTNPPPPAFDVDDNPMRFQVTLKWNIAKCPAKCDVKVINDNLLTVIASFATDKKDTFDVFERSVALPTDTVSEKATGKYKDGVLVVEVPKFESWKRFYI